MRKYRIRIDFVGINLSNPEQVSYQFKLDGYEEEWSDISNVPYAFYGRVEDGDYTFMLGHVMAMATVPRNHSPWTSM